MTNIDREFRHLAIERDALHESNQNISDEKQNLEYFVNQLKVANEKDSRTIHNLEQLHEARIGQGR
jgi:hypothetical protein